MNDIEQIIILYVNFLTIYIDTSSKNGENSIINLYYILECLAEDISKGASRRLGFTQKL